MVRDDADDIARSFDRLRGWLDMHGERGFDVCDVGGSPPFMGLERVRRRGGLLGRGAGLARTAGLRLPHPALRRLLSIQPSVFPQALGNLAAAWVRSRTRLPDAEARARHCLQWLRDHPSGRYDGVAWGQPYDWVSRTIIERDVPRATVTSIVGHAFVDAYEAWGASADLETAIAAAEFMFHGLHRTEDPDGDFCFSYTSVDRYCVHNANMVAAGLLARVGAVIEREEFLEAALRASRYTVKHQMADGAWDYRGPPDEPPNRIDNYHSGFVVEALALVHRGLGEASPLGPALERGLAYYRSALFDADGLPRTYPQQPYPVNVQSAAQAMITFALLAPDDGTLLQDARRVARWTIAHLQGPDGHFGYKVHANGRIDMTPYLRWTESWMARGLASLIEAEGLAESPADA